MTQPVAGTAGRRAPRRSLLLAALTGLCMVIVMLAAQPAHAQDTLGNDVWEDEGRIPADRYALTMPIGFDPAHGEVVSDDVFERVKRIGDSVMYFVAALFHDLGVMITRLGLWLLDLAFSFTVLEAIREAAAGLSRRMQSTFVAGIGLDDFAVFLAVFYCGIQLLRRRTAHSLGELAASMLIAVVGATLVANPLRTLDTTAMTVRSISVAIMDLAWEEPVSYCGPPDNCSTESRPSTTEQGYEIPKNMSDQLYQSMIVEPYDIANWGQVLTGSCASKRDEFLRGENHTDEDLFVKEMWAEGCREQVIFNTSMSFNRVGVALLTFVVRGVLLFFNAVLSASVMGGQFLLGQVAIALPLFVVSGIVPGTGRQIALKGLNATGQAGAAVILAGFMLTVLVAFQTALLGMEDQPLLTRYVFVLVMVIMLWRYRGPVRDMINEIILHFTQRLKTSSPGNVAPNLLGDRELWENSVKKRLKENIVDSSYRGTRGAVGKGAGLLLRRKRHKGPGAGTGPGGPSGTAPAPGGRRRPFAGRRTPQQYVHDVKEGWKRGGKTTMKLMKATGRGTKATGRGLRKGAVRSGGVAGVLTKGGFYKETGKDLGLTVAEVSRAGARAAGRGARAVGRGAHATARAVGQTPAVTARLTRAATRATKGLGHDMADNFKAERAYPRSVLPGARKRVTRRRHAAPKRKAKTP